MADRPVHRVRRAKAGSLRAQRVAAGRSARTAGRNRNRRASDLRRALALPANVKRGSGPTARDGAGRENRTLTVLLPRDFESRASTSSAIPARAADYGLSQFAAQTGIVPMSIVPIGPALAPDKGQPRSALHRIISPRVRFRSLSGEDAFPVSEVHSHK